MLKEHDTQISIGRKRSPCDNAACEWIMTTLKQEEVYRYDNHDFHGFLATLGEVPERVNNRGRLHSPLGYLPHAEFERNGGEVYGQIMVSKEAHARLDAEEGTK